MLFLNTLVPERSEGVRKNNNKPFSLFIFGGTWSIYEGQCYAVLFIRSGPKSKMKDHPGASRKLEAGGCLSSSSSPRAT